MNKNNIHFLTDTNVVKALAGAQIETWLFGGWAEEHHGNVEGTYKRHIAQSDTGRIIHYKPS